MTFALAIAVSALSDRLLIHRAFTFSVIIIAVSVSALSDRLLIRASLSQPERYQLFSVSALSDRLLIPMLYDDKRRSLYRFMGRHPLILAGPGGASLLVANSVAPGSPRRNLALFQSDSVGGIR